MVSLIKAGADPRAANNHAETPGSLVEGSGREWLEDAWVRVLIDCDLPFDKSDKELYYRLYKWESYSDTSTEGAEGDDEATNRNW
jgi:hypothetical protein